MLAPCVRALCSRPLLSYLRLFRSLLYQLSNRYYISFQIVVLSAFIYPNYTKPRGRRSHLNLSVLLLTLSGKAQPFKPQKGKFAKPAGALVFRFVYASAGASTGASATSAGASTGASAGASATSAGAGAASSAGAASALRRGALFFLDAPPSTSFCFS